MLRELTDKILSGEISLGKPIFESANNRTVWGNIPPNCASNIIKFAENYINYNWPSLLTTNFLEFERTGNREAWETPLFERRKILSLLILAECIEYKGRFLDDITNGIVLTCEETYWGLSAHRYGGSTGIQQNYDPYLDIFASDAGAILSMAIHLLKEKLDITVIERVKSEIKFRMLDAFLKHNDYWWQAIPRYEGEKRFVNNWNPWICENLITAYIFASPDEEYMRKGVSKVLEVLDIFADSLPEDGGCDEGINYWGVAAGALYVCLEQLYISSNGDIDLFDRSLIKNAGNFYASMFISENYVVNFNDSVHKTGGLSWLLFYYGKRTNNQLLCNIGKKYWIKNKGSFIPGHHTTCSTVFSLLSQKEICEYETNVEFPNFNYIESLQILTAWQDRKNSTGLFLATKGGHNDESHNHNDVGTLTVYANATPLLVDPGKGTYSKDNFNENRYKIWYNQTSWHNLPEINGVMQCNGRNFCAENVSVLDGDILNFDVDLHKAWQSVSGLEKYHRNIAFDKMNSLITVTDSFTFVKSENIVTENMIFSVLPKISNNSLTAVTENGTEAVIEWNVDSDITVEHKDVNDDTTLCNIWKDGLWRVRFSFKCGGEAVFKYSIKIK